MELIDKIKLDIFKNLSDSYSTFDPTITYVLSSDSMSIGTLHISKLLQEVFNEYYSIEIDFKSIEVYFLLSGQHENITIDCNFPKLIIFKDDTIINELRVIDTVQDGNTNLIKLVFHSCRVSKIMLISSIEEIVTNENFLCNEFTTIYAEYFLGVIKKINIDGLISKVTIRHCKSESININNNNKNEKANISEISLYNVKTDEFNLSSTTPTNLSIKKCVISKITTQIEKFSEKIILEDIECENILFSFDSINIDSFTIFLIKNLKHITINSLTNEEVDQIRINTLKLSDLYLLKDFQGNFSALEINTLKFHNVINKGDVTFAFIKLINPAEIFHSILGSVNFFNCQLTDYISFHSSNIEEWKFYNTKEPVHILPVSIIENKKIANNNQIAYRQMKISAEKSGNKERANYFRSRELDSYYKSLSFFRKDQRFEKITIGLNSISNKHGMSWWRPLWLYFILVAALYFCFLTSLGGFYISDGYIYIIDKTLYRYFLDWYVPSYLYPTKSKLSPYFECFNISDFTAMPVLSKAIVIVNDILLMPYLIYQFIAAFRRHGMK